MVAVSHVAACAQTVQSEAGCQESTHECINRNFRPSATGLEGLGQRLTSVKTYLQSQIKALSGKQDQTIAAQAVMQEHLSHVGADVESTRMEVSEVRRPWQRNSGISLLGVRHAEQPSEEL